MCAVRKPKSTIIVMLAEVITACRSARLAKKRKQNALVRINNFTKNRLLAVFSFGYMIFI